MQSLTQFNQTNFIRTVERDINLGGIRTGAQLMRRCKSLGFRPYSRLLVVLQNKRAK